MTWRNGFTWMVFASAIYLFGALGVFFGVDREIVAWAPTFYIMMLSLPFIIPPLGRWLNLNVTWDKDYMFNFFKKPEYKLPEETATPKAEETPKEEPVNTYYSLGLTSNNRVSFKMGYTEITMNAKGVDNMIKQLKLFRDQLEPEVNNKEQE